jgi:hypothetical protein
MDNTTIMDTSIDTYIDQYFESSSLNIGFTNTIIKLGTTPRKTLRKRVKKYPL